MNKKELAVVAEYRLTDISVFHKVKEEFGGLSNMSNDFKVRVNGILMKNTEALYQACRFPHLIEVQRDIIDQHSGMASKMKSKPHRAESRADWDEVRIEIMRWCIRVKLAQNFVSFGRLLESTGNKPIVEYSLRDAFWGAKPAGEGILKGQNVLGKLLMEIRDDYLNSCSESREAMRYVEPLEIENFLLLDQPIMAVGQRFSEAA